MGIFFDSGIACRLSVCLVLFFKDDPVAKRAEGSEDLPRASSRFVMLSWRTHVGTKLSLSNWQKQGRGPRDRDQRVIDRMVGQWQKVSSLQLNVG